MDASLNPVAGIIAAVGVAMLLVTSFVPLRVVGAVLFAAGLLMFSLNICLIHLAGITVFRALTPYGGMAFVAAWLTLAAWAWRFQSH